MESATLGQFRANEQLSFALQAAGSAMTRSYRPRLTAINLTYPQYLVMMVLWDRGSATVGAIAGVLSMPSHAVTPIVTRLQTRGLVRREMDPGDRRINWITPTECGLAIENDARGAQEAVGIDAGMTIEEMVDLRDRLLQLAAALNAHVETG